MGMEFQIQYEILFEQQINYCNATEMTELDSDHSEALDRLVTASIAFLVIGTLTQISASVASFYLNCKIWKDEWKTGNTKDMAKMALSELGIAFVAGLLEDVPQTMVAMFYLKILYQDTGYNCYRQYAQYPQLTKMDIDPSEQIIIIMYHNYAIFFAVVMSMIMIIFSGMKIGWKLCTNYVKRIKLANIDTLVEWLEFAAWGVGLPLLFILDLLLPIAIVLHFYVARDFEKSWVAALGFVVAGSLSWFISLCSVMKYVWDHP